MTNGERLKYLREKNGLTQKDVAKILGVESAAISKYELDMREPNIEALDKLANTFNVSVDYLLGRVDDAGIYVKKVNGYEINISVLEKLYNIKKKKIGKVKEEYKNENAIIIAKNELCSGSGKTTYGECKSNSIISTKEIEDLLVDFQNSKLPSPQIIMEVKDIKNGIIIVEIDSFDDEEMPFDASDRIALYTAKLSQKYNVLSLVMSIDKGENCKITDAIYQKKGDLYHTELYFPKTVLTAVEYIDILRRL